MTTTTKQQHTPEPWENHDGIIYGIEPHDDESVLICDCAPDNFALTEFDEANARRIVACVNACAGIPNAELAEGPPAFMEAVQWRKQRDELAAALRILTEWLRWNTGPLDGIHADLVAACELLAKVQS